MSSVWLIIFVALVVFELATVNLVSIWFAVGALASFTVSLFLEDPTIQIGTFVIVSFISLVCTKSVVRKIRKGEPVRTNLDRVIGQIGIDRKSVV